ncbi:phosphotransferase family protein [Terriglobus sp. ADX1]|uniref:phosphotransferase family protein n=1 Tax=Terriglobus sp. ADX1 TaxID=2794063 RepID=UPI002FE6BFBE
MARLPLHSRHAEELRRELLARWNVTTFVVGFFCDQFDGTTNYAITELLAPYADADLTAVPLLHLLDEHFAGLLRDFVFSCVSINSRESMMRIGWLDEAISWVESVTRKKVASKAQTEQLHVGSGFCLMKFHLDDGHACWLKAVGSPNIHETGVTRFLSRPDQPTAQFLPSLIAFHEEWNALLMEDGPMPLQELPTEPQSALVILREVVSCLARLQIHTISLVEPLLQLGAFDQQLSTIAADADKLCGYLDLAMSHQTSSRVPPIASNRLRKIFETLKKVCTYTNSLGIPTCLVHGDLNPGNVLLGERCIFIDWSEAYVGYPLASLQHVLLLNRVIDDTAREWVRQNLLRIYCGEWCDLVDHDRLVEAIRYMPLIAAASALYGRGDWLNSTDRESPARFSYARTLARHMDRAVATLEQEFA